MLAPFEVCNFDIYRSSKTKLKEQNNSVFGMAIETWPDYDPQRVCYFVDFNENTCS